MKICRTENFQTRGFSGEGVLKYDEIVVDIEHISALIRFVYT